MGEKLHGCLSGIALLCSTCILSWHDRGGVRPDPQSWRSYSHHILGQILAGGAGMLLMGRHESDATRDLAAALCILVRHRSGPSWALLVPLQNGQPSLSLNTTRLYPSNLPAFLFSPDLCNSPAGGASALARHSSLARNPKHHTGNSPRSGRYGAPAEGCMRSSRCTCP